MPPSSSTSTVVGRDSGRTDVRPARGTREPGSRLVAKPRSIASDGWFWLLVGLGLFLGVFFGYPLFEFLRHSFTSFIPPQSHGVDNYRWLIDTSFNWTVLGRTLLTSAIVTVVCALLAYPYAYLMTLVRPSRRLLMLSVVILAFWTSAMVKLYAWIVLLQDNGVINKAFGRIGIGPIQFVGNISGVMIGMVQLLLPYMVLPLFATLQGIDRRMLTAAHSLGATPRTAFFKVYLPLSAPGLLTGSLLVFVVSLGYYLTPALLGSTENSLFSQLIVTQVNQNIAFGRAGAMTMILLIVTFGLIGLAIKLSRDTVSAAYGGG